MNVLLLLIFVLTIYQSKMHLRGFNTSYLEKEHTDAIKGIFIFFVFFRHFTSYIEAFQNVDMKMLNFNYYLDQLLVVMFLFYSGYGVALSIYKKGEDYIKDFPRKRILPVILRFDVAVLLFLLYRKLLCRFL